MTQSQCSVFLFFFKFYQFIFQNSHVLGINRFQWMISAEGKITVQLLI
jgi:hypothetical protein